MGIDSLSFNGDNLTAPDTTITVMGWRPNTHSFDAKVYIQFIEETCNVTLYQDKLTNDELKQCANTLDSWSFEESNYGISTDPTEPDGTAPDGVYSRGPLTEQEVDDLQLLFTHYANQNATLDHYF